MKKTLTIISLLALCTFFACKKEETQVIVFSPTEKEIEVSGLVLDFETNKPIQGIQIMLDKRELSDPTKVVASTDINGLYTYKFVAKKDNTYFIGPRSFNHIEVINNYYCGGDFCLSSFSSASILKDTFYLHKAGNLNIIANLDNTIGADTITVKGFNKKNGKIIDVVAEYKGFTKNYLSNPKKTLADRMTYLSWKLKSETKWHQDSIFTPFGKTVNYEIKY